jgi:hypothetical protein
MMKTSNAKESRENPFIFASTCELVSESYLWALNAFPNFTLEQNVLG